MIERSVLRGIAEMRLGSTRPTDALRSLSAYQWKLPDHRVIYGLLLQSRASTPEAIREEFPAAAARLGFPEIDWNAFFSADAQTYPELNSLDEKISLLLQVNAAAAK